MALKEMYPGMVNSPETTITNNINESDTIIYVLDPARVPEPPNLMTLGTGTNAETVKVLEMNDNAITVERGFQGVAKSWPAGTVIARNFTEYDYGALKDNIEDLDASKETPAGAQAKAEAAAEAAAGAVQAELDAHLSEIATQESLGHVKVDDTTIIANNGVITALPVQSIGGWTGAVLDGCAIENNKVILDIPKNIESKSSSSSSSVYGDRGLGQKLLSDFGASKIISFSFEIYSVTGSPSPLILSVFDETTSSVLEVINLGVLGKGWHNIDLNVDTIPGHIIQIRLDCNGLGDYSNHYSVRYNALKNGETDNTHQISTTDLWSNVTDTTDRDIQFKMDFILAATTGTFYIDHTPPNLIDYGNIYFNKFIPAVPGTQRVELDVTDTDDNVLIADVQNRQSLASIDPMTYPTIRLAGTLTRADAEDDSPSIGPPIISYIGTPAGGE